MSRSKVLLKWGLELINEPERKSPRALPPSSPPEAKKRSPPSSGGRSPAIPTIEKPGHHKRHATYGRERSGGVPLPKPINTNLKPPTAEKAGGTPNSAQAPPSPYQPTVEEIPDEGSPDEDKPLHVEEYHMTPPDSTFGSASDPSDVAQSSADAPAAKGKDAQRTSAQISSKRKEKIESLPKVVLPDFTRKTSYKKEEFLSPSHAERRPESLSPPVDPWQRQQEDFPLWDSTEDEFEEERKMGAQTPFNVESLSAMNTPKDTMPPPSPRPRRRTQSRSSYQQTDPRSAKQSPRYSPGHSPWVNTQSYADDGRIRGANGKEKYTPQPSPKEAQKEFISARRPRAATHSQGAPYPSDNFSAYGGNQTFHFMAGGAGFVAESGDIFDKFFAGGYGSGSGTIDDSAHWSTAVNTGKGKDKVPQSAWSEAVGDSGVWSTAGNNGKEKESTVSSRDERSSKSARGSKDDDAAVKEITTQIALEEFYKGTTRKMKVTDRGSKSYRILELPIRPGLKTGSKIKFSGIELDSGNVTGDIHFIVQEVSPSRLSRKSTTNKVIRNRTPSSSATATTFMRPSTSTSTSRYAAGSATSPAFAARTCACATRQVPQRVQAGRNATRV